MSAFMGPCFNASRNVRLAAKLTDWKIVIEPESQAGGKPNN
jgi:hypothetical protein